MPPKAQIDPNEKRYIYLKVVGGEIAAAAALAPKCGPLGLPQRRLVKISRRPPSDGKESRFTLRLWSKTESAL